MVPAIGILLVGLLFVSLFCLGRRIDNRLGKSVLRRQVIDLDALDLEQFDLESLMQNMARACGAPVPSPTPTQESAADTDEVQLSRQLLDGAISAATYRQRMSDLAHGAASSGGAR